MAGTRRGYDIKPATDAEQFLDTEIKDFHTVELNPSATVRQLMGTPELQVAIKDYGLKQLVTLPAEEQTAKKINISLTGVTLRAALHKIARAGGGRYWVFQRYKDGSMLISIPNGYNSSRPATP